MRFSTVLRAGAVCIAARKRDFSEKIAEKRRICTRKCGHPHKKAVSGVSRNRMTSASGFTWVAREPQLMFGAKGRASAQRFLEYHHLARFLQLNKSGKAGK
jgi:hypothetical protein